MYNILWCFIKKLKMDLKNHSFSSVQSLSCVWLFATLWTAASQASLSITNPRSLLKFMSIESVMPSNHLVLCRPVLLLPSIFPSIRVFSNESILRIKWPKYWSFSFSISPANEYSGLFSFRMNWLDLLAIQGTQKSLLQHHSSKASILMHPQENTWETLPFLMVSLMSAWPDYIPQLFSQKVICVFLCRYFVDVIEVHNQLILSSDKPPWSKKKFYL